MFPIKKQGFQNPGLALVMVCDVSLFHAKLLHWTYHTSLQVRRLSLSNYIPRAHFSPKITALQVMEYVVQMISAIATEAIRATLAWMLPTLTTAPAAIDAPLTRAFVKFRPLSCGSWFRTHPDFSSCWIQSTKTVTSLMRHRQPTVVGVA